MRLNEIPKGECFSSTTTKGSYYKENVVNGEKQTYHKYDEYGCVQNTNATPSVIEENWFLSYKNGERKTMSKIETIDDLVFELKKISHKNHREAIECFLSGKLLIQKGVKNRHPFADVFHKMVEDLTLLVEMNTTGYDKDYKPFTIPYGQYRIADKEDEKAEYAILRDDGFVDIQMLTALEASKLPKVFKVKK